MICRLCLIEMQDFLEVFTDTGEMIEREIVKIVAKHFQIEIRYDDTVSNRICKVCWQYLQEFHKFWLSIDEKQQKLQSQLECTAIKRDVEDEVEACTYQQISALIDNKDAGLCEPEIDMLVGETETYGEETEFVAAKMEDDGSRLDGDSLSTPLPDTTDILSRDDIELQEFQEVAKPKRKYTKRSLKVLKLAGEKRTSKRERPNKSDKMPKIIPTEVATKAESARIYENKLKTIQEMDDFLAENTQLNCCICTHSLKDFKELKKHFRQEHHCTGYVLCCDMRFAKRTLYVDHLKWHKNPEFFKCSTCNKQLISRKNYINHMHTQHPAEENLQFVCKLCPKKFSKQYILDSHIKMRHTSRDHVCKICDKAFTNTWILRQHEKSVHRNEFESVCEICGKRLKTVSNLQYHMEYVHNTEPRPEVECKLCHKWLKSERSLRKHMIMHRDEASGEVFKCSKCDVVKNSRHALASHIRYHHSDKVFTCTMCGKEFKTSVALKEHEATHTGVHLYTCPFCPKTFRSHANMHKHKVHSHSDEWVRKYAQPNEYTQSVLNQTRKTET